MATELSENPVSEETIADIGASLGFGNEAVDSSEEGKGSSDADKASSGGSQEQEQEQERQDPDAAKLAELAEKEAKEKAAAATAATDAGKQTAPTPPKTWKPEAAALFGTLPPAVQAEIARREEEMFTGLETYKADATFGKSMQGALQAYLPTLQQYGIKPEVQVQESLQATYTLAFGTPEQKVALLNNLVKQFRVDPASLIQHLQEAHSEPLDPQVKALQQKLETVEGKLTLQEKALLQQRQAEIEASVAAFAKDPANVYFNELMGEITQLLKSGVAKDLPDAYKQAIWLNPAVRDKEIARLAAERQAAEKKAAEEKAAAARKASAVNVSSNNYGRSTAAAAGSLDDTLAEALAAIKARG